jgi:osmotically-inducible protein OsmY
MIRYNSECVDEYDRDLERRVLNYLVGRQMPSLRNIQVEAQDGTVILRGQVHSFYQKQLCLNCCRRVAGVQDVVDQVEVVSREPDAWLV